MAAKTMKDYLSAATADYTTNPGLSVNPQVELIEEGFDENTIIYEAVDGTVQPVTVGGAEQVFFVTIRWEWLTASDAGTIIDLYFNAAKADKKLKTFYWLHPTDGNTYVARFASEIPRTITPSGLHKIPACRLRVTGYKA